MIRLVFLVVLLLIAVASGDSGAVSTPVNIPIQVTSSVLLTDSAGDLLTAASGALLLGR